VRLGGREGGRAGDGAGYVCVSGRDARKRQRERERERGEAATRARGARRRRSRQWGRSRAPVAAPRARAGLEWRRASTEVSQAFEGARARAAKGMRLGGRARARVGATHSCSLSPSVRARRTHQRPRQSRWPGGGRRTWPPAAAPQRRRRRRAGARTASLARAMRNTRGGWEGGTIGGRAGGLGRHLVGRACAGRETESAVVDACVKCGGVGEGGRARVRRGGARTNRTRQRAVGATAPPPFGRPHVMHKKKRDASARARPKRGSHEES